MQYLIQSSIDQNILDHKNDDCFFKCKKMQQISTNWSILKCPEGKGWCCSQIIDSRNFRIIIPFSTKKQNTRTYFSAFRDLIESNLSATIEECNKKNIQNINDIIVHNSKNIHNNIVSKFQNIFPDLDGNDDKIMYIFGEIEKGNNKSVIARELLSIWKSLGQLSFQYSVDDYIGLSSLEKADFVKHRIYTIVKMSFYQYEDDFIDKGIRVNISESIDEVYCNFNTVKAAFCALFENCIKYCRTSSDINITFSKTNNILQISFSMHSRIIHEADVKDIFEYGTRGKSVKDLPGKGVGLWMMKKMMLLNKGDVSTKPSINTSSFNNNEYGENEFIFKLHTDRRELMHLLG